MKGKLEKLKSRKLWVAVFGAALIVLGTEMGISEENMTKMVGLLSAYLVGQGIADHGKAAASMLIASLAALCLIATPPAAAGTEVQALPPLPDQVENPSWLERGSIWTFGWADVSEGDGGAGLRLGYEITDLIRVRFDYLVESFDFDEGVFADQSEATISMRYDFGLAEEYNLFPYLIAGGGSASLSKFEFEYLIGAGIDYEFNGFLDGVTAFTEFIHIRAESSDLDERNEFRLGLGVPLDRWGTIVLGFMGLSDTPQPPLVTK